MLHEPGGPYELAEDELAPGRTTAEQTREGESLWQFLRRRTTERAWLTPLILWLVSAAVFGAFAWERALEQSPDPHFVYLANTINTMIAAPVSEAAANTREDKKPFEMQRHPPHNNDWANYWELTLDDGTELKGIWLDEQGEGRFKTLDGKVFYVDRSDVSPRERNRRYFVSFPPGPAVLMTPLAAIWGYDVNDVLFTIFFAALNVALMYILLRKLSIVGRSGRSRRENLWLTVLFGFGTAHLWCSVLGQVWFTALIVGVTFALLYMLCAIDARHPLLAGIFLAAGFATRTPLVFTSLFFFAFVFFPDGSWRKSDWGDAFKRLALFCVPCLLVGSTLLWMNYVRFDSITEFGHTYLAGGSLDRIKQYGLFNIHFLSKNLTALLTLIPRFQPDAPFVIVSKHGMSLFLTTPAFIYLFLPKDRESRADKFWWRLLWVVVGVVAVIHLLYQNTGYEQFGYRFSLDYMPYLIVLLAVGRRPLSWVFKGLTLFGIIANGFGAVTFKRYGKFSATSSSSDSKSRDGARIEWSYESRTQHA